MERAVPLIVRAMENDLRQPVGKLYGSSGQSIVSKLLEIQKCQIRQPRTFDWARTLTCLSTTPLDSDTNVKVLHKQPVSIVTGDYVAVSYKWKDGASHNQCSHSYRILSEDGKVETENKVSTNILHRVLKYANAFDVPAVWIDQESINQNDPDAVQTAIQSMDLVYRCSDHPLGVLTQRIEDQDQLDLLLTLMQGELTVKARPVLASDIGHLKARRILRLLDHLTTDPWWTRRWIFQEDYCSFRLQTTRYTNKSMKLLIPHCESLLKDQWDESSRSLPGEVILDIAKLRTRATLFLMASKKCNAFGGQVHMKMYNTVLDKIKSYKIKHVHRRTAQSRRTCRPMSMEILSDITKRDVSEPGDTLAIFSNCSSYTIRIDRLKLQAANQTSLSLAMLTLCLLNGEVMWTKPRAPATANMLQFLDRQIFDKFEPPVDVKQLTFMKKTRLVNVRLLDEGIKTTGHLWRIRNRIRTRTLNLNLPPNLTEDEVDHRCLLRLATELKRLSYKRLAHELHSYLDDVIPSHIPARGGLTQIFDDTASLIALSVAAHKDLIVAQHYSDPSRWGIFVCEDHLDIDSAQSFIFTASEPPVYDELVEMNRSPGKYVSLLVRADGSTSDGLPWVEVEGWVNGLTFPGQVKEADLVFKWPDVLTDIPMESESEGWSDESFDFSEESDERLRVGQISS